LAVDQFQARSSNQRVSQLHLDHQQIRVMTDLVIRDLPTTVVALIEARLEESLCISSSLLTTNNLDSTATSLLTSHLTAEATASIYYIPPPNHSAILVTALVHPTTTNTPLRHQASQLLSRILDVASPREAKFNNTWTFARLKRKRGSENGDDSDSDLCGLETESLFAVSLGFWQVLEWAFYKAEGGWEDLLALAVRMLRIDFDEAKGRCKYEIKIIKLKGKAEEERDVLTEGVSPGRMSH
jgi:hypothetical protein